MPKDLRTVTLSWSLDDAEAVAELFERAAMTGDKGWADDAKEIRRQVARHEEKEQWMDDLRNRDWGDTWDALPNADDEVRGA